MDGARRLCTLATPATQPPPHRRARAAATTPRNAWMRMLCPTAATQLKSTARPNIIHKSTSIVAGHIVRHPPAQCSVVPRSLTMLLKIVLRLRPVFRSMIGLFIPTTSGGRSTRDMVRLTPDLEGFRTVSSSQVGKFVAFCRLLLWLPLVHASRLRFDAIYAGNPATPDPEIGSITSTSSAVVITAAAAADASAGASKMHPIYRCSCVAAAHCFIARACVTIVCKFSNRARAHRIIYCIMYQILPSCSNLLHLGCGCSTG